jgi:hypothetical protein
MKKGAKGRAPMAHTCHPSYSGGRDQENRSLKPIWAKKYPTKKGLEERFKV